MAINVELRQKVGTGAATFEDTNSLMYVKTHANVIDGLFVTDGTPSSGIKESLLPQSAFGGMRLVGTISGATTTASIQTSIDSYVTTNGGSSIGCFVRAAAAATLTESVDHTLTGDENATDFVLEAGDWVICTDEGAGDVREFMVMNNQYKLATTSADGLLSAADKVRLDAMEDSANNYSHPSDGGTGFTLDGGNVSFISDIAVNTKGHVTNVALSNIRTATLSVSGVTTLQNTLSAATNTAATPNIVNLTKTAIDNHIGDTGNPHSVTKTQVGLSAVQNYSVATTTEAQEGTASNKYMTAERAAYALDTIGALPLYTGGTALSDANDDGAISLGTAGYYEAGKQVLVQI